ncbi:MAG TPA: hypothetical protein VKA60_18985 [Blastocatellia bacterium]|nr:hypothetical protein [Blastocatellia bacterium]
MERDQEVRKLTNVLRRIARAAWYAAWNRAEPSAARFCALQYNRVLRRLETIEPAVKPLFAPLPETASPQVIRMAAVELAAFFDDEADAEPHERQAYRARRRHGCRPRVLVGVIPADRC